MTDGRRQAMFTMVGRRPFALESLGAYVLLACLVGYGVWVLSRPAVYQIAPGLFATKQGPAGFPIVVRIGQDGLDVTNGSDDRWTCHLRVQAPPLVRSQAPPRVQASLTLDAGAARHVAYAEFSGASGALTPAAGYRLARRGISVRCNADSGTRHLIHF